MISIDSGDVKESTAQLPLKTVSPKRELERDYIKPSAVAEMIQKPKRRRQRRSSKIKKIGSRSQKGGP